MNSGADIRKRTYEFAVRVLAVVRALSIRPADQVIARQLARSGTSVGANVEEAQSAHSRIDFARRMNIARAEARETLYWPRLLVDAEIVPAKRLRPLIVEAEEIVKTLVAIVKKLRTTKPPTEEK
jgi:four helix bundle protein